MSQEANDDTEQGDRPAGPDGVGGASERDESVDDITEVGIGDESITSGHKDDPDEDMPAEGIEGT